MMTEVYGLSCRSCTLLPESKLSQKLQAHHGLVPKLSHYDGKNIASLKNRLRITNSAILRVTKTGFLGYSS